MLCLLHAEDEGHACQAAGMEAFLSRPFGIAQLRRVVAAQLDQPGGQSLPAITPPPRQTSPS